MCDPVTAGLILTGVSGGATVLNNNAALRRADRETARGIRNNAASQREANDRVNEQISDLAANTGEAERAASLEDFQNALRSGRDATDASLSPVVNASDRFVQGQGDARAAVRTDGEEQAQRLSVIDGILRQRINEGQDIGRTGSDLNRIKGNIDAEQFLSRLRASEQRPNMAVDLLAGIGKGIGSGLALKVPASSKAVPGTIIDTPIKPTGFDPFSGGVRHG